MGLLNPRAIALQGIGTGVALLVAVQGLLPTAAETPTTGGGGVYVARPRLEARPNPYREDEEILVIVAAALLMLNAQ